MNKCTNSLELAEKADKPELPMYCIKMTSQEVASYLKVSHQYILDAAEAEIKDHQKPPEDIGFVKTLHGYCMNTLALSLLTAKLTLEERYQLGGYVSELNNKAMMEELLSQ